MVVVGTEAVNAVIMRRCRWVGGGGGGGGNGDGGGGGGVGRGQEPHKALSVPRERYQCLKTVSIRRAERQTRQIL